MVNLTINGKAVQAEKGEMLLAVIERMGINIPAICHHDAVEPTGNCRLCMVEITKKDWDGWKKSVTSCLYPVEEGLIVQTHTDELHEIRKTLLDLQLANCPNSAVVQKMAAEYGVHKTSFEVQPEGDDCIMCYACTRICEVLGRSAIVPVDRGHNKVIAPPFGEEPEECIGCLSCAHICPTDHIKWHDKSGMRVIWDKKFELIECKECGKRTITREFADYLIKERDLPEEYFDICDDCKRKETAKKFGSLVIKVKEASI